MVEQQASKNLSTKADVESNYGSEIGSEDESALTALLTKAESHYLSQVSGAFVRESTENGIDRASSPEDNPATTSRRFEDENGIPLEVLVFDGPAREASVEVEYDPRNRVAFSPKLGQDEQSPERSRAEGSFYLEAEPVAEDPDPSDSRTPLQRFKSRRPLSVTNIVSPAWCEIQYWYSLTKYGRVRRTKAMEQGSSVHKVMEEQTTTKLPVAGVESLVKRVLEQELKKIVSDEAVAKVVKKVLDKEKRTAVPVDVAAGLIHKVLEKEKIAPVAVDLVSESVHKAMGEKMRVAVSVEVVTKEDAFGLRIWNLIQGLRNLRATGSCREVEVWAVVEGEVVNGVIDELSYECPDDELEAKIFDLQEVKQGGKRKRKTSLAQNQPTLKTLWHGASAQADTQSWLCAPHQQRKVYLADIKTRGSKTVPTGEAALRPTIMQLMMYHRMLSLLASNSVPADEIFTRYNLDGTLPFSDSFIAQIGSLELNMAANSVEDTSVLFENEQDAVDEILAHNTLHKLWTLMMAEFARAIPFSSLDNATSPLGDVLKAEYRASGSGAVIGVKTFAYDASALDDYLKGIMAWWRGERMPRGVDIEEAYKCRMCEFADRCAWRKEKVDQSLKQATRNRLLRKERSLSQV